MSTKLVYFAWVREAVGVGEEEIRLPPDLITAGDLVRWMAARGGGYAEAFANATRLRCAVDQVMIALDAPLGNPKEIAFFPPVTGG
jgi:sulfur-carrier protein